MVRPDFLSNLLARTQRGELTKVQFRDELGLHVADVAGQIQAANASIDDIIMASFGIGTNSFMDDQLEVLRASAVIGLARVQTLRPLFTDRELCTKQLIMDKSFELSSVDPHLAATLYRIAYS